MEELLLAKRITERVNESFLSGEILEKVSPTTKDLLRYWFDESFVELREKNFHRGQRQAILNIIYLHEVLKIKTVFDMYKEFCPSELPLINIAELKEDKYNFQKYCVKMATGTGKTWVMHALVLWQVLNARREEEDKSGLFTKRFLFIAPGLIVYDRLLDAFLGKINEKGERDFHQNDFYQNESLFIPPQYRDEVYSFIQQNTVAKEDISRKVTGDGFIGITNWHLFLKTDNEGTDETTEDNDFSNIVKDILPARPGINDGNKLDVLDRQYLRGGEIDYLSSFKDLMIINDEAHHIHTNKKDGEKEEVQWQQGINEISKNKDFFFQIDFSATPYSDVGSGKNKKKNYFPHIVIDYDLKTAMREGKVKTLLIDNRQEITDIGELNYKAEGTGKDKMLSDGQKLMLSAGLTKLQILEQSFVKLGTTKYPKMMVVCEDTSVTSVVEQYLRDKGLQEDDILCIDSNKQGEVGEKQWLEIKERLFNVDKYSSPKVIISVLMLREGFDVNNICVIVPLRASESHILLEQIIGRGLRLMFREKEYEAEKIENHNRIYSKQKPNSYIDMLSIIEHPRFIDFYKDLLDDNPANVETDDSALSSPCSDMISVPLKEDYKKYDMFFPVIIKDKEETITPKDIDINKLQPFNTFTLEQLQNILARNKGEVFSSHVIVPADSHFGEYRVNEDLFKADTYNQYLQKILTTITQRMERVTKDSRKYSSFPMLQINEAGIIGIIDSFIRTRLFNQPFNPFENYNWKILLANNGIATQHIIKQISKAIIEMQNNVDISEAIVEKQYFSQVNSLIMREGKSLKVTKSIYERLSYPSNKGGLEKAFIEYLDSQAEVESFIKIRENRHLFAQVFYEREDGLLSSYHPDFMAKTDKDIFIIETKGEDKKQDKNVKSKQIAMIYWCNRINSLPKEDRDVRQWHYILLTEKNFYTYRNGNVSFTNLCNLNKVSESNIKGELFN